MSCADGNHFNGNLSKPTINPTPKPTPPPVVSLIPIPVSAISALSTTGQGFHLSANHTYNDNNSGINTRSTEWKIFVDNTLVATLPMALNSNSLSYAGLASNSTQGNLIVENLSTFLNSLGYTTGLINGSHICFKSQVKNGLGNASAGLSSEVCTTTTAIVGCSAKPSPATNYNEVGDGSAGSPYEIWTPEQFNSFALSGDMAANYIQCTDIDFTPFYLSNPEFKVFSTFNGSYDGSEFLFNHFKQTDDSISPMGIFQGMQAATIRNMRIIGAIFNDPNDTRLAALVSDAENSTFSNNRFEYKSSANSMGDSATIGYCGTCIISDNTIQLEITSGTFTNSAGFLVKNNSSTITNTHVNLKLNVEQINEVGGFSLYNDNSTISKSSVKSTITQKDLGLGYLGGNKIVLSGFARATNSSHISESFSQLTFTQEVNVLDHWLAGFVFSTDSSDFTNVYAKSNLTFVTDDFRFISGFARDAANSTLTNSYVALTLNASANPLAFGGGSEENAGLIKEENAVNTFSNIFTVSNINVADPIYGTTYNRTIDNYSGASDLSTLFYASDTSCPSCTANGTGNPVASFYTNASAPVNTWDFSTIWKTNAGTYPTLINNPE